VIGSAGPGDRDHLADTGDGIPPHELPRLRGRSHDATPRAGSGCHRIAQEHGGEAIVRSEHGLGASSLRLPEHHA
jgi:signal transduction histidine kinase